MIKKILFLILCLLISINICYAVQPTPIPNAENIIFIDTLHPDTTDKELIIFQDGIYYGTFNYSDTILFNPDVNYTIIINEGYIDIIQDDSFLTNIISRYGNIIISIFIIISFIGFMLFIYNKTKGK